jgi:hypothetical protein
LKTLSAIVLVTCCLFVLCPSVAAQNEPAPVRIPILLPTKFSARVNLVVDVPENIEQLFADCLMQELRSIGDIILTNNNPQYRITVMALPNRTEKEDIGFTFSILISRPIDMNILRTVLSSEKISEDEKKILVLIGKNYEKIEKTSLLTCSPNELGRICKEIVSGFNADILENDRRMWNSAWSSPSESEDNRPPERK